MSAIRDRLTDPLNSDDLNELVLESAAVVPVVESMPEVIIRDETIDAGSHRVEVMPAESDKTIAEKLVNAGNLEADLELRLTPAINRQS